VRTRDYVRAEVMARHGFYLFERDPPQRYQPSLEDAIERGLRVRLAAALNTIGAEVRGPGRGLTTEFRLAPEQFPKKYRHFVAGMVTERVEPPKKPWSGIVWATEDWRHVITKTPEW
jgi:hypothetical protein